MIIDGVILAGGQGRRMGGADKALLTLGGQTLLSHAIACLAPQVRRLALSANGDPARFADHGLPVLGDAPGHRGEGPLAGILAALDWAAMGGADALLTLPVDAPFAPTDLARRLAEPGGPALATSHGRLHPTAALWPVAGRAALATLFASGERRLRVALAEATPVAFDATPDPFANLNTPDDLAAAEARIARPRT